MARFELWDLGHTMPVADTSLRTGGRIRPFLTPLARFRTRGGIAAHPPQENRFKGHLCAFSFFLHPYGVERGRKEGSAQGNGKMEWIE